MQQLPSGRASGTSDQSASTIVDNRQDETKSERTLQAILDELRKRPALSRYASNISTSQKSSTSEPGSPEERFYQQLFTGVVAFCVFGGSITFQCIFSTMPAKTRNPHISPERARTFIGISWLLFTMDLSLSSIVLAALYVSKQKSAKEGEPQGSWHKTLHRIHRVANLIAALILPLGSVAALIFASLAVSVLSLSVGKTALISVIVLGGAIVIWWVCFCLRHWYKWRKGRKEEMERLAKAQASPV